MYLFIVLALIFLSAIPEGLSKNGYETLSEFILWFYRAFIAFVSLAYLSLYYPSFLHYHVASYWRIVAGYFLVNFALYSATVNKFGKYPILHIGSTKLSDRTWNWFFNTTGFPMSFLLMLKIIALITGIAFLIKPV